MEKVNSPQLELFSQQQNNSAETKSAGFNFSFFNYMRGYEKTILLIIAFLTIGIISFSLGVEKGKGQKIPVTKEIAAPPKIQQPAVKQEEAILQGYTIQIASYQARESARKEAELLKKKGLNPIILSKGKYSVLCVGSFSNREKAQALLLELEKNKRYKGCIIRRL